MRLLYVASGHPLQEADDCLMWEKLDIDWFSTGYYAFDNQPGDLPLIENHRIIDSQPELLSLVNKQRSEFHNIDRPNTPTGTKNKLFSGTHAKNLWFFTQEFVDEFDVIFFNHFVGNVVNNWNVIKDKHVVLKTYSMHQTQEEPIINKYRQNGLRVVRNSPKEHLRVPIHKKIQARVYRQIFGGVDAVIRGSVVKDEHEVSGWTGKNKEVVTFCNYLLPSSTADALGRRRFNLYKQVVDGVKESCNVYGVGNGPDSFISHKEKIKILQDSRVSLIVGTPNSNNTYAMVEAWIMGLPIVAFGPHIWQSNCAEIHELIDNGVTGFYSDKIEELQEYIKLLMDDHELAKKISKAGRERALEVYGREALSWKWAKFFMNGVLT